MKMVSVLLSVLLASFSQAQVSSQVVTDLQLDISRAVSAQGIFDWKVGDENNYTIDMSVVKGSMKMSVREIGQDGIWVDQLVDLGFAGKQTMSILYDPNTGEVKKILVNGQEQQIPENTYAPIEVKSEKITVPAGTFDCTYAKLKDDKGQIAEAWISPEKVSIGGSIKMIQPSQVGKVTVILKSYKRN